MITAKNFMNAKPTDLPSSIPSIVVGSVIVIQRSPVLHYMHLHHLV
ncbi:hypothetical protein pah_c188o036 [Parachlamydia acanthamoebae str. Hall's coccus]|nr:hypothetical protein pah_c188o036 [Parachlamydia acanthamoebae str. Hall's coccus]